MGSAINLNSAVGLCGFQAAPDLAEGINLIVPVL
jgi:hypothetical protein